MQELKGKKVLLIEDDVFITEMIVRRLKMAGASCDWAKNGEEGLDKLRDAKFDIVITDLMMAQMMGDEMIKKIKADKELKDIPIVVYSNFVTSKKDFEKIEKLGVNGIFIKSNTSLGDFINKIAEILNNK